MRRSADGWPKRNPESAPTATDARRLFDKERSYDEIGHRAVDEIDGPGARRGLAGIRHEVAGVAHRQPLDDGERT